MGDRPAVVMGGLGRLKTPVRWHEAREADRELETNRLGLDSVHDLGSGQWRRWCFSHGEEYAEDMEEVDGNPF
jgi:hypothetical protein